jgi:hypothetical protein
VKDEALRPFARIADHYEPDEEDGQQHIWSHLPTIGEVRHARKASATGSDLLERLKKAEAEVETMRQAQREEWAEKRKAWTERDEALALCDLLGKALEERGHRVWCPASKEDNTCTCGLDAALSEWKAKHFPEPKTQTKTQ